MELSNDWHKKTNKRLFDILSDIMKESNAPKIPDHGYTIAERAPEVVTAPGVYFPSEKGRVIPLESRQLGGRVGPKKSRIQQLEEAAGISEPTPETVPASEPTPATPAPKGFIAPPYTGPRPWRKDIPTGSRQSVGMMAPKSTGTVRQILERLASYSPFPIPGVTTQKEEKLIPLADIMVDKKKTPLLPRQNGGEVDPNLFKETFSVNYGSPTQEGINAATNTALVGSTPIAPAFPSQSVASKDGVNPTPTITPSTSPPTGMAEYEANARKIRGLPPETGSLSPVNPTNNRLNQITGFLRSFMSPQPFKENTRSPIFGSDQRTAYEKKYKPYFDFMKSTEETPLFPRDRGGVTSPDPLEGLSEEERKRRKALLKTESPTESLASQEATEIPKAETQGDFYEMRKEILPSGETRYTLPGTEGTATVGPERFFVGEKEVPKGTPGAVSGDELARQGVLERATPPELKLPERGYYEAHPEERFMDIGREENKPLMDAYQRLIEENTRRSQGFGLPMNPKVSGLIRAEATRAVPELTRGLEQTMALNQAMPERYFSSEVRAGRAGTPHWVQNEKGEWVGLGPTGITPTGVIGKTTTAEAPGRRSEQTFDPKTGQTYQQDFDWREGAWQPVGERRVVGGPTPKEKPFKDRVLETIWGALTPDEQKKVLGAGIDPHEVTERDILSIQGNLMTSPETRKILQPLAESIIKKASEKSAAEKIVLRNPGETIEEYLKRTKQ